MTRGAQNPSFLSIFFSSACARLLVHVRCPLSPRHVCYKHSSAPIISDLRCGLQAEKLAWIGALEKAAAPYVSSFQYGAQVYTPPPPWAIPRTVRSVSVRSKWRDWELRNGPLLHPNWVSSVRRRFPIISYEIPLRKRSRRGPAQWQPPSSGAELSLNPRSVNARFWGYPGPHPEHTIRNARITILIPLEYFDVMHMKSLRKRIPPEFSDVIITYISRRRWGKRCKSDKLREIIRPEFFDVNQDERITRNNFLITKMMKRNPRVPNGILK